LNVYFISGLGADSRIFKHIKLPPNCTPVYLDWIKPNPNESLADYAARMAESIDVTKPFSIIGLSLGGMIAVEIAKIKHPKKLVLISSIATAKQLPPYYRFGGVLRLHKWVPVQLFKQGSFLKRFFTAETSADKRLIRSMIRDCDPSFIRWGMNAVLGWENKDVPQTVVHIHGSADFILPKKFAAPTHIVPGAGHLAVLTHSAQINAVLNSVL